MKTITEDTSTDDRSTERISTRPETNKLDGPIQNRGKGEEEEHAGHILTFYQQL